MSERELKKQNIERTYIISILKIILLLTIVIGIPLYIYFFHIDFIKQFESFEDVVSFLEKYETESIPIYIGLQVLQIVISVLPGQAFQLAAGYMYTFFPALIYALIGAALGTVITFAIARILGRDFVHLFFGKEKTHYYTERLNSKKGYMVVFILYLIPGLPKDMISYVAGVSDMKFDAFLLLSLVGRLPGMMGSIMIGSMWHKEEYVGMILLGILAIVAFILGLIFHKKIHEMMDNLYDKISK